MRHRGGCHCGRVRFSVEAPAVVRIDECNCSICRRTGFQHLIVAKDQFTLEQGADDLTEYQFNTGTARHLFCRVCGIKSFYVPRSHPHGISVNARCIDAGTIESMEVHEFDGDNWEANVDELPSVP